MTNEQRTKRAKSNLLAGLRVIGIAGTLRTLAAHSGVGADLSKKNPKLHAHYVKMTEILTKAAEEFSAECNRFDEEIMPSKS